MKALNVLFVIDLALIVLVGACLFAFGVLRTWSSWGCFAWLAILLISADLLIRYLLGGKIR